MLKALIVGADSVAPNIIFQKKALFPNLSRMIDNGVSAAYSAYVQKGFNGSYSSEQNWASLYTGLEPLEHQINTHFSRGEERRPQMKDFDGLHPFWKVLNDNGYSVGLWAADNCVSPIPIDGYVISTKYEMIATPQAERKSPRTLEVCEKDREFASRIMKEEPPYRLYPKTLEQQGYSFEEMKRDAALAEEAIRKYHFQDSIDNFKQELEYWFSAMKRAQRENPVDVLFFYTPTTDLIAHCCMYCEDNPVLLEAYRLLDEYIGDFVKEFMPEMTIFVSDHGQQNFNELIKCSNSEIQKEVFASRDEVIWLKNGYIAFQAYNGALLFTAHALKGTFIAMGKGIKKGIALEEMRTVDFYPTLLEMFEVPVPCMRKGFVLDVFEREMVNENKRLLENKIAYDSIALIQTGRVSETDIVINELYNDNRFAQITVVGEGRYRDIFENNPRVFAFVSYEDFCPKAFSEIYCGVNVAEIKAMRYVKVSG